MVKTCGLDVSEYLTSSLSICGCQGSLKLLTKKIRNHRIITDQQRIKLFACYMVLLAVGFHQIRYCMCNPLIFSCRYLSPNNMFDKRLLYFLNNYKVMISMVVVVRSILIVIIDHRTDHSSGVEDTSSLQGCSAMSAGKQFNDCCGSTSFTISVNVYQLTQHNIQEDLDLQITVILLHSFVELIE